jgi:hypothetical protein
VQLPAELERLYRRTTSLQDFVAASTTRGNVSRYGMPDDSRAATLGSNAPAPAYLSADPTPLCGPLCRGSTLSRSPQHGSVQLADSSYRPTAGLVSAGVPDSSHPAWLHDQVDGGTPSANGSRSNVEGSHAPWATDDAPDKDRWAWPRAAPARRPRRVFHAPAACVHRLPLRRLCHECAEHPALLLQAHGRG